MVRRVILALNQYKHINRPWEKQDRPLPSIHEKEGLSDNELAYVAGSMFGAGADTVSLCRFRNVLAYTSSNRVSSVTFIVLAAALNPEAQAKVQEELDAVVGRDRCKSGHESKPEL